jgi:hypothetical protein
VQGFGNVGSAAFYLAEMGASWYNRQRWRFNKRKRLYFEVRALFLAKDGNTLVAENMIPLKK